MAAAAQAQNHATHSRLRPAARSASLAAHTPYACGTASRYLPASESVRVSPSQSESVRVRSDSAFALACVRATFHIAFLGAVRVIIPDAVQVTVRAACQGPAGSLSESPSASLFRPSRRSHPAGSSSESSSESASESPSAVMIRVGAAGAAKVLPPSPGPNAPPRPPPLLAHVAPPTPSPPARPSNSPLAPPTPQLHTHTHTHTHHEHTHTVSCTEEGPRLAVVSSIRMPLVSRAGAPDTTIGTSYTMQHAN